MKTKRRTYLTILFIVLVPCAMAQNTNTMGTDFWVAFMDNIDTSPRSQSLSIFAASERVCSLTVTNPNTGWAQTMTISPNTNNRCFIPLAQGYTSASGQVTNTGLHVTSTDTISLYTITLGNVNVEYTDIRPTEMLGSDYMVQSYPADRYNSEFTIVATENNTVVDIHLRGNALGGYSSGQSFSVTLPVAGKAYQLKSTVPGDLSGTRITARGGKKIAVFNGDACAYIPNLNTGISCDHLVEQAIPTNYWGKEFIVPASQSPRVDYVRVTSLEDNCTIARNGTVVATLNSGGTYEYTMSTTTSIDYIQTSVPAIVYIYFPSLNANGNGDPSMTTIAPIEQHMAHCRFPIITTPNINLHYTHVICRSSQTANILIDGNQAASSFSGIPNAPGYSYARIRMNDGIHSISSTDTSGYIAYITGFGSRVSYGYCLGYACRNLARPKVDLFVGDVNASLHPEGFVQCLGDYVTCRVESADSILLVRWLLNGTPRPITSFWYRFPDTGQYQICAIVHSRRHDDTIIYIDTLCTTVRVYPHYHTQRDDTCVENQTPVRIGSHLYYRDTVDTVYLTTRYGCDSIIAFSLKVWRNDSTRFDTVICDTLLPFLWHGILFRSDSTFTLTLATTHGADSLVTFSLQTRECQPPLPPEPPEEPEEERVEDTLYIWIPNVFTPGSSDSENSQFRIHCSSSVVSAEVVIYQRWGDFLCRFDGLTGSWDGTYQGRPCPQGTYVYQVTYKISGRGMSVGTSAYRESEQKPIFGSVTLLR